MSLRARIVISVMILLLAGMVPIGWFALRSIDQTIRVWHDARVGDALQQSLIHVENRAVKEQVNDALIRYKQLGALQRPMERQLILIGITLAAFIVILASLVSWFLAVQLTRPLHSVARAAEEIARGDLTQTVPPAHIPEIAKLVHTFNEMVASLRQSRAALARAERRAAWQDIARAIAHEIKNPLTPMRLTTQRLREHFDDNRARFEETFRRSTDMILAEIDRLERLANAFSSFAKMPVPAMAPLDARALLNETADLFPEERDTGRLTVTLPSDPITIMGDTEQLKQAVLNLVKNAFEAAGEKDGRVSLNLSATSSEAVIAVHDNGAGIAPEVLETLFQPYISTKSGGSGIGLAIVDRVVTDHQGRVTAQNVEPHGALFSVHLPLRDSMYTREASYAHSDY
jgi:nitrogen fixation/metabolism regulation signal transduction histidine kinase